MLDNLNLATQAPNSQHALRCEKNVTGFVVQREAWNWNVATFLRIALGIAVFSVPVWIGIAVLGGSGTDCGEVLVAALSERNRVVKGEFAEIPIRVSNKGSQPIQLLKIQSSCGCVTAKPNFESLAPRESSTIHVSFHSPFT